MTGPRIPLTPPTADPALGPTRALARATESARITTDTPEQARRVLQLQRLTGYTTDFIRGNRDAVEQAAAVPGFDPERFAQDAPLVSQWMADDPSRVAFMAQDFTRMGTVEKQVRHIAARFTVGRSQTRLARIGEAALAGTVTPEQRAEQDRLERAIAQAPDYGVSGFVEGAPGAAAQQVPLLARNIVAGAVGAAGGAAAGAATGAAVGVIGGPGGAAIGARAGAKFGAEVGAKAAVAYDVAVMEASLAYLDFERLTDANGQTLDAETARGAALIAGALAGSLELLSLQQLAKVTPGLRDLGRMQVRKLLTNVATREVLLRVAKQVGLSAATEGVTEGLQSLITQGGGTLAVAAQDGRLTSDLGGVLAEAFGPEALAQAGQEALAGAQAGLIFAGAGGSVSAVQDVRRAHRAERQLPAIVALADAGADAKVTADAPQEVASLVTTLQQSGLSGFSYDAAEWTRFWQTATLDADTKVAPREIAEELGVADAYDVAVQTGGSFEVPLGDWLTKLVVNPTVRAWAVQHAKVGPGEMSAAEALAHREESDAVLADLVDAMVKAKEEVAPTDQFAESLRTRVEASVRASGRPVREAQRAGELWATVYRTWAAESGSSPADLMAMFNRVRIGETPVALTTGVMPEHASPETVAKYITDRERPTTLEQAQLVNGRIELEEGEGWPQWSPTPKNPWRVMTATGQLPKSFASLEDATKAMKKAGLRMAVPPDRLLQAAPVTVQDIETMGAVEAHEMRAEQPNATPHEIATSLSVPVASVERWLATPKPDLTPEQVRTLGLRIGFAQQGEATVRGAITFTDARQAAHVQLFSEANASTFFHESAHLFLTFMEQLAASPNASARIKADYAAAREWLGAPSGPLTVAQEEQWARGFEAYLFEGKAPSIETRSLFATMQAWLTRIYRSIRGLDVELNADIRRVFDRLLATDAAIQEAQQDNLYEPLFPDASQVMPAPEAAQYAEAIVRSQEAAGERLRVETLAVIAREEKAWYKARKEELRPEVVEQVHTDPAMIARTTLQSGTMPDGTELDADSPLRQKLDRTAVDALLGDGAWKRLPRGTTAASGGLHPDVAASALGYGNGTDLLAAIGPTQSVARETESRLNARLREEYGDPLTDGDFADRAVQSIHVAERDRVTMLELQELQRRDPAAVRGLLRRFGGRVPVTSAVQAQADRMLAERTIKSIRPIEFQRAEVKAAKEAIAAAVKGEWAVAAEAKIRERLASALYRASLAAGEEIGKAQARFAKMFRPDTDLSKSRDLNLVNAARAVLARVGLGRAKLTPEEYLAAVEAYDPETFEALKPLVLSDVPARNDYTALTLAEFRAIDEQATALWDQSKRTRQMTIDGKKVDREYVIDTLAAELVTLPDRMQGAGLTAAYKPTDTIRRRLLGFEAALRRVESWVDQMDQSAPNGPWRRFIWTPISEAAGAFRVTKRDLTTRYLAIAHGVTKARWDSGQIAAPELGYTFRDRQELLGAMLHTGNLSNFDKLTRGRRWDPASWAQFVGRLQREGGLTVEDYTFLQGVWDLFESVKPDAQRVHKELLGFYFDEITAEPVITPFGTFRGGYVPALADPQLSEDARLRQDRAAAEEVNPTAMFPSVSRGFTKSRVEGYARPLVMDLRLVRMHVDAVSRFIHLALPTKDVGRLTMDRRFRDALGAVDPEMGAELSAWVQRAGHQVVETPSRSGGGKAADAVFRWLRTNSGLQIMALNVTNTLQQFTGLSIGAVKVQPKYLRNALWQAVRAPRQTAEAMRARSTYMETRLTTATMDVERRIDQLIANPTKYEQARAFATEHGYILQSTTQGMVDTVVWLGAFDEATAGGQNEKDAVRIADAAVRLTQGSFAPEDVSRFETGSPFVRAFTMFYSYFNMQANLLRSEFAQAVRQSGLRKGSGRLLYVYVMGFMIPAVLSQIIVEAMAGGPEDEDDDGYLDEWMGTFFSAQMRTAFALVPGGNVVLQAGINQFNDKWYDDRVNVSPAVTTIEAAGRGGKAVLYDWWVDGDVQRRDIRDVLTLLSLLSRLPLTGLARPAGYVFDVQQGEAEPTGPVDFTRGLLSGRP